MKNENTTKHRRIKGKINGTRNNHLLGINMNTKKPADNSHSTHGSQTSSILLEQKKMKFCNK